MSGDADKPDEVTSDPPSADPADPTSYDGSGDYDGPIGELIFDPSCQLAIAALRRTLPASLRASIERGDPTVVLIEVPGESWVAPAVSGAYRLFKRQPQIIKPARANRHATGAERDVLVVRRSIVAVADDLMSLPSEVVAAADARFKFRLTAADIRMTLEILYGKRAAVRAADIAGLDWRQIVVAFRPGSTPRRCVERLRKTSEKLRTAQVADAVPSLDALPGHEAAMRELKAVAADVVRVRDGASRGERLPSVLLHGRPGTGKTMLARSLARTVGLPMLPTSVGEWFAHGDSHLGAVVNASRLFFDRVIASAPCIAFIDEIDALPDRARLDERNRDWWTPLVTAVLLGIDRVRAGDSKVVLVGATNHFRLLDAALVRPGRFDRHVEVRGPETAAEVEKILRHHLRGDLAGCDLKFAAETALALGMTGAGLENAVRVARELARAQARDVRFEDLLGVIAPADPRDLTARTKTAIHEAGHAVIAYVLGLQVEQVSVVRNGMSLGMTSYRDDGLMVNDRAAVEAHIVAALGGRAADEVISGAATAGAMSDLKIATRLVAALHGLFGLGDALVSRGELETAEALLDGDPAFKRLVGAELQRLMDRARDLAHRHAPAIRRLAHKLLERRIASATDIVAAFDGATGAIPTIGCAASMSAPKSSLIPDPR